MTLANVISNPDKVFWPDEGYTKLDLARFYQSIFPKLKPYVAGRLLTMERCPDGMLGECFYQKEAPASLPAGTPTKMIHHANRDVRYVVGGPLQTQLALVNLGCIPVHIWQSRAAHQRRPDWIVFDLDPSSGEFADAARAGMIGVVSENLRKPRSPRPLRVGPDFDEVLLFARNVCERLAAAHPRELTIEARIEERQNRVYLDALRNSFGATVAAPYSVRRRPGAPFSIPLRWSEVKPSLVPSDFNIGNYREYLSAPDPWKDFFRSRQSIRQAAKRLARI
jgi:bifunctional non-homologous end joining protein LigD